MDMGGQGSKSLDTHWDGRKLLGSGNIFDPNLNR